MANTNDVLAAVDEIERQTALLREMAKSTTAPRAPRTTRPATPPSSTAPTSGSPATPPVPAPSPTPVGGKTLDDIFAALHLDDGRPLKQAVQQHDTDLPLIKGEIGNLQEDVAKLKKSNGFNGKVLSGGFGHGLIASLILGLIAGLVAGGLLGVVPGIFVGIFVLVAISFIAYLANNWTADRKTAPAATREKE